MVKVLVYGHFKAVHLGHFRLFEYAQSLGDSLFVAINTEGKNESDISFSESVIKSFPFTLEVIKYSNLDELLRNLRPDIVVRGQEFRNSSDQDNNLIKSQGIKLLFGSGSTYLSEEALSFDSSPDFSLRESFKNYAALKGLNSVSLKDTLRQFSSKKVMVIGDLIIDEFINCQPIGMSQEDPVVVSTPISSSRYLGGAGIVAAHCKALGAKVDFVSLSGDDEPADWALKYLAEQGVETTFIRDANRPTVVKQRFKHANQTLFRLNHFRPEEAEIQILDEIIGHASRIVANCDLLIFSDFSFGTLHPHVVSKLMEDTRRREMFIAADSQSSSQLGSLSRFKEINLLTPTEHEARLELRNEFDGIAVLTQKLVNSLRVNSLILKLGADGVLLGGYKDEKEVVPTDRIPSANSLAVDVSGAGDSLLAVSSLSMACGRNIYESAYLGSVAAGVQVSRKGNIPIQLMEVEKVIDRIFQD